MLFNCIFLVYWWHIASAVPHVATSRIGEILGQDVAKFIEAFDLLQLLQHTLMMLKYGNWQFSSQINGSHGYLNRQQKHSCLDST